HPLFSNDMVLQREIAAPIWGWSTPDDSISVKVDGKATGHVVRAGNEGRWTMKIGPFPPGGPHTIVVEGKTQKVTIGNVLFAYVWLCTGQSNMNWPVRLANTADEEVKQANY